MSEVTDIPVTDSQGIIIGSASIDMTPDGADVRVAIFDGHGMAIVRSIAEGTYSGLSIRPTIPPFIEATTVDR
jgi:hypothetical protein